MECTHNMYYVMCMRYSEDGLRFAQVQGNMAQNGVGLFSTVGVTEPPMMTFQ